MPIDLKEFSAACVLVGVDPPKWNEQWGYWVLHWHRDNWQAFVAVNKAYNVFDTRYAESRVGMKSGHMPIAKGVFSYPVE